MPVDLGDVNLSVPAADWRVALFLVVAAAAATAFFALMPALQATRIDPVRTMRGELVKDARPGRARNALIGVQVFASALLLICAAIFLRSAIASSRFDPGFRTADTVLIDTVNEPKRAAMLQAIAGEPTITAHAAVRPPHAGRRRASVCRHRRRQDAAGLQVRLGRVFRRARHPDRARARVHGGGTRRPSGGHRVGVGRARPLAEWRWRRRDVPARAGSHRPRTRPRDDEAPMPPRMVTVVGVSRDVPGFRFTDVKDAGVFLPTSLEAPKTSVVARVKAIPTWPGRRSSSISPGSIRTWA